MFFVPPLPRARDLFYPVHRNVRHAQHRHPASTIYKCPTRGVTWCPIRLTKPRKFRPQAFSPGMHPTLSRDRSASIRNPALDRAGCRGSPKEALPDRYRSSRVYACPGAHFGHDDLDLAELVNKVNSLFDTQERAMMVLLVHSAGFPSPKSFSLKIN